MTFQGSMLPTPFFAKQDEATPGCVYLLQAATQKPVGPQEAH